MGGLSNLTDKRQLASTMSHPKPPKKRYLMEVTRAESDDKRSVCSALLQLADVATGVQGQNLHADSREKPSGILDSFSQLKGFTKVPKLEENPVKKESYQSHPLNLSTETTIKTSQQNIIDHIVEKMCTSLPTDELYKFPKATALFAARGLQTGALRNVCSEQKKGSDSVKPEKESGGAKSHSEESVSEKGAAAAHTNGDDKNRVMVSLSETIDAVIERVYERDSGTRSRRLWKKDVVQKETSNVLYGEGKEVQVQASEESAMIDKSKRTERSCKGKKYLQFMSEGRLPVIRRGKCASSVSESASSDDGVTTYRNGCNGLKEEFSQDVLSSSSVDFCLSEKTQAVPSFSFEEFQKKKKTRKKHGGKKAPLEQAEDGGEEGSELTGSKRRKARKRHITHISKGDEEESSDPPGGGLAALAEVAAHEKAKLKLDSCHPKPKFKLAAALASMPT